MFDWLKVEMATIKNRAFHIIDGPLPSEKEELVRSSSLNVPPSYKAFVIQFGNAKLYRTGSQYRIQIYDTPKDAESKGGEQLLHFGRTDSSLAYFKLSDLKAGEESPVYEWTHSSGLVKTADGFEAWVKSQCKMAKNRYSKSQWKEIERGPVPFSDQEQQIVEARRQFDWQIIRIESNKDVRFEIKNNSQLILPYLTLMVRSKEGNFHGSIWLPTRSILPGQTGTVDFDCYKKFVDPTQIELHNAPDPLPELRDRYWEFKK